MYIQLCLSDNKNKNSRHVTKIKSTIVKICITSRRQWHCFESTKIENGEYTTVEAEEKVERFK